METEHTTKRAHACDDSCVYSMEVYKYTNKKLFTKCSFGIQKAAEDQDEVTVWNC
jgi:hypothetical protein